MLCRGFVEESIFADANSWWLENSSLAGTILLCAPSAFHLRIKVLFKRRANVIFALQSCWVTKLCSRWKVSVPVFVFDLLRQPIPPSCARRRLCLHPENLSFKVCAALHFVFPPNKTQSLKRNESVERNHLLKGWSMDKERVTLEKLSTFGQSHNVQQNIYTSARATCKENTWWETSLNTELYSYSSHLSKKQHVNPLQSPTETSLFTFEFCKSLFMC